MEKTTAQIHSEQITALDILTAQFEINQLVSACFVEIAKTLPDNGGELLIEQLKGLLDAVQNHGSKVHQITKEFRAVLDGANNGDA